MRPQPRPASTPRPAGADQILSTLIVREALDELSPPHAEVLHLILEESLTQAEIAERLGLALGTVKSRTFNGMRALRSALGERGIHAA